MIVLGRWEGHTRAPCSLTELPADVPDALWRSIITNAIETLVEGYCRAKKVPEDAHLTVLGRKDAARADAPRAMERAAVTRSSLAGVL